MCLGIPAKVIETHEGFAIVDMAGIKREVSTILLEEPIVVGDYVLVHVGFAISKISEKDAEETLNLLKEMSDEIY
jgi:hydrogenase expression/formation protein HypC